MEKLVPCVQCKKLIPISSKVCPLCGFKRKSPKKVLIWVLIIAFIGIAVFGFFRLPPSTQQNIWKRLKSAYAALITDPDKPVVSNVQNPPSKKPPADESPAKSGNSFPKAIDGFMGIKWEDDFSTASSILEAKGFRPSTIIWGKTDRDQEFEGIWSLHQATVNLKASYDSVIGVDVHIYNYKDLLGSYKNLLDKLTATYGSPTNTKEEYLPPYTKDDGNTSKAILEKKATLIAEWLSPPNKLILKIVPYHRLLVSKEEGKKCEIIVAYQHNTEDQDLSDL